ncbi:MAG: fibronectin type III domain-containing protein [Tepidisphaeraceae bacterium]|jgi:hypothetical protein
MSDSTSVFRRKRTVKSTIRAAMQILEPRLLLSSDYAAVFKEQEYVQTGDSTPVPTSTPNDGAVEVNEEASGGAIQSASVTFPDGTKHDLIEGMVGSPSATFGFPYSTQADLDAAWPGGTYTIKFTDGGGTFQYSLSMPDVDTFPTTIPQVSNISDLGNIDPSQSFTLSWNPWDGATTGDYVKIQIIDTSTGDAVYDSPWPFESSPLLGTDTSDLIPAGTLQPNTTYTGQIFFIVPSQEVTGESGVPGFSGFTSVTEFTISTSTAISVPAAPTNVTGSLGSYPKHVLINWTPVSGATSYQIFRSTSNSFSSATKIQGGVTGGSFADSTASPGVLYYYWVVGRNSSGVGTPSDSTSGYIPLQAPTLTVTDETHHLALTWTPVTNASTYQVWRSLTNDVSDATRIANGVTDLFFNDTSVSGSTDYFYWVRAKNSLGVGAWSNVGMGELT